VEFALNLLYWGDLNLMHWLGLFLFFVVRVFLNLDTLKFLFGNFGFLVRDVHICNNGCVFLLGRQSLLLLLLIIENLLSIRQAFLKLFASSHQVIVDVFVSGLLLQNSLEVLNSRLVLPSGEMGFSASVEGFQIFGVKCKASI